MRGGDSANTCRRYYAITELGEGANRARMHPCRAAKGSSRPSGWRQTAPKRRRLFPTDFVGRLPRQASPPRSVCCAAPPVRRRGSLFWQAGPRMIPNHGGAAWDAGPRTTAWQGSDLLDYQRVASVDRNSKSESGLATIWRSRLQGVDHPRQPKLPSLRESARGCNMKIGCG